MHAWTMDQTIDAIAERLARNEFTQHVVVNVAKLVQARDDSALRASIEACEIVNIDGMGVVWGARFLGYDVPERVAGIDLFHRLVAFAAERGEPVFLLGARPEVVESVQHRLRQQHPQLNVAGIHHGYFWDDEQAVVDMIRRSGARLLFVAISSPAKEMFVNRWRNELGVTFAMGVGGTFDVVAGKSRRAPGWMQRAGLEWFYRLLQEPRRMWRRYLVTNAKFAWLLLRYRFGRNPSTAH